MKRAGKKIKGAVCADGKLTLETIARLADIEGIVIDNEPQTFRCRLCQDRLYRLVEEFDPRVGYKAMMAYECACRPAWVAAQKERIKAEKEK